MFRKLKQDITRGDTRGNLANRFRQQRINFFISLLNTQQHNSLKILDIGGTDYYWTTLNIDRLKNWQIILLNPEENKNKNRLFKYVVGDGRDLSLFKNESLDVYIQIV
jgi:hypothetical protein